MITSAFLIKVVVFGLAASLVIPVIDFLFFVIRESRKTTDTGGSTLNEWHPSTQSARRSRTQPQTGPVEVRDEPARVTKETAAVEPISGRFVKQNGTVAYMASNGVTITPGFRPAQRPNHPHSDYWQYGNMSFYERR